MGRSPLETGDLDTGQEAFASLFHQYRNLIFRTAYLMIGNVEDAEDITQEVFLRVYHAANSYLPSRGAMTTWLHRITVNLCIDRRRKFRALSFSLDEERHIFDDRRMEQQFAEAEFTRWVLGKLSDKLRAVIVLRYYLDLSYQDIADVLELPIGTVKSRLALALESLHPLLHPSTTNTSEASAMTDRKSNHG